MRRLVAVVLCLVAAGVEADNIVQSDKTKVETYSSGSEKNASASITEVYNQETVTFNPEKNETLGLNFIIEKSENRNREYSYSYEENDEREALPSETGQFKDTYEQAVYYPDYYNDEDYDYTYYFERDVSQSDSGDFIEDAYEYSVDYPEYAEREASQSEVADSFDYSEYAEREVSPSDTGELFHEAPEISTDSPEYEGDDASLSEMGDSMDETQEHIATSVQESSEASVYPDNLNLGEDTWNGSLTGEEEVSNGSHQGDRETNDIKPADEMEAFEKEVTHTSNKGKDKESKPEHSRPENKDKKKKKRKRCRTLSRCKKMNGKCRHKKSGCKVTESTRANTENVFCAGKSCLCCMSELKCTPTEKCSRLRGICQSKHDHCSGKMKPGKSFCGGKNCTCCIPSKKKSPDTWPTGYGKRKKVKNGSAGTNRASTLPP